MLVGVLRKLWSDFYEISLGERVCMAVQSGSVLLLRPWPAERGGSCGKTQNMISVLYILGIIKTKLASVSLCCKSRRFKQQIAKFYSQIRRTFMSVNSPKKAISCAEHVIWRTDRQNRSISVRWARAKE